MARHRRGNRRQEDQGQVVDLVVGELAAGGVCVAHHDGATFFVRGALPEERVRARVTASIRSGRIKFATVQDVYEPSPYRVDPPCPAAGICGGCDLQHVDRAFQLRWKAAVVAQQLQRIGGIDTIAGTATADFVQVQQVGEPSGLGWRTRFVTDADPDGALGFHRHRSATIEPVSGCPIAVSELQDIFSRTQSPGVRVHVALGEEPTVWTDAHDGVAISATWRERPWHIRQAMGRQWRVATDGFWQAHRDAADILARQVQSFAAVSTGDRVVDLYAGVGLFAAAVGDASEVIAVEGDPTSVRLARRNLHQDSQISIVHADVREYRYNEDVDVTVMDPPRSGAGPDVIARVARHTRRAIVHVGCDGANTARDLRVLLEAGWQIVDMVWFDLFPMTHHVESVALLQRITPPSTDAM